MNIDCPQCGCSFWSDYRVNRNGHPRRFCSLECARDYQVREKASSWSGGRYVPDDPMQSISVLCPSHPRANRRGHVAEQILVVEQALGRYLPSKHPVHHVDRNRHNNAPENLVICENEAYHHLLHARLNRLRDTGSLELKLCRICQEIKPLHQFGRDRSRWDGLKYICIICEKDRVNTYYTNHYANQ